MNDPYALNVNAGGGKERRKKTGGADNPPGTEGHEEVVMTQLSWKRERDKLGVGLRGNGVGVRGKDVSGESRRGVQYLLVGKDGCG